MIYTATVPASDAIPQHSSFVQRKIPSLTQSKMGDLNIHAKPTLPQIAYDGYRENIEAFLWATATGKKVETTYYSYPLTKSYNELPLPIPKFAMSLKTTPTTEGLHRMRVALDDHGFQAINVSKKTTAYVINHPTSFDIMDRIKKVANPDMGTPSGYATVASMRWAEKIYSYITLFLRTNTYPAFHERYPKGMTETDRAHTSTKRPAATEKGSSRRKVTVVDSMMQEHERERGETPEVEETTLRVFNDVLTAKPSPMPFTTCCGPPSAVPNLPGLVFPYFPGLLSADPKYVRDFALRRMFRLLPEKDQNARVVYKELRNEVSPFAYTTQGIIVTHIMKGIDLALESQSQLFVLFDGPEYLGFSLLGGGYHVFDGRNWVEPLGEDDLQAELSSLVTHTSALEEIITIMNKEKTIFGEDMKMTLDQVDTPVRLARALGLLSMTESKDEYGQLTTLMERLRFPTNFKALTLENFIWLLRFYKSDPPAIPDDLPIFIPFKDRARFRDDRFLALCAFGSRAPSFFSSAGSIHKIPHPDSFDPQSQEVQGTKALVMPMVIVSTKPALQAYMDNERMVKEKAIKQNVGERAKESRCIVFKEKSRGLIWEALRNTIGRRDEGEEVQVPGPSVDRGKGRAQERMEITVALEDVF